MADDQLVTALSSLTTQISQLNQFYQQQSVAPNIGASASAIPQSWSARATMLNNQLPSMPDSNANLGLQQQQNLAVSNPSTVADDINDIDEVSQVIAASTLGGGAYRQWKLGSYNLQRNLQVANQVGNALNNTDEDGSPGTGFRNYLGQAIGTITNGGTGFATPFGVISPGKLQAGIQIASTAANTVGHIDNYLGTQATIGQTFGYGAGLGGNAIGGFRNPTTDISSAQRVGQAFAAEQNYLTGRNTSDLLGGGGLTTSQASSVLDTLGNQGFSMNPNSVSGIPFLGDYRGQPSGDAATIANQFMAPLMSQMPGLSSQTLGQFTPALRNSATSAQQLADALADVNTESQSAKESVNQFTTSLVNTAQGFANMGANLPSAIGTASGFSESTGLDPAVAGQLAQSPIFQGLALGQGVLPSGIGNMGGSAFTSTALAAVRMLSGGLQGLNRNTYKMIDGHRTLETSGSQAVDSQIASMLGIPETVVARMLGSGNRYQNIASAEANIGSSVANGRLGSGIWNTLIGDEKKGGLNNQEQSVLQGDWGATEGLLRKAGLSSKEMRQLNSYSDTEKGWRNRLKQANADLAKAGGQGNNNKIKGSPNQHVTIGLTPQAAKMLQLIGVSPNKALANAALGPAMNSILSSPTGDTSDNSKRSGWTADLIHNVESIF